jgi:hypothetical protein
VGEAAGIYGKILKSTNGGTNWFTQIAGTINTLYSVFFADANTGWAVGYGGTILKTTNGGVTFLEEEKNEFNPYEYVLEQNYPNPFNPTTKIRFSIPSVTLSEAEGSLVTLKIYDVLGNEVATLVNENKPAGSYEVEFGSHSDEGQNLPAGRQGLASGIYFYRLQAGSFVESKKMVLLK